eukprot:5561174-Pleurochrysis_carterae.AAC.2
MDACKVEYFCCLARLPAGARTRVWWSGPSSSMYCEATNERALRRQRAGSGRWGPLRLGPT